MPDQVSVKFNSWGASITLGDQHISRMTHAEVRSMVCTILVFGGKDFREEVKKWLNGETLESVAAYLAPAQTPAPRTWNSAASATPLHGESDISGDEG